MVEFYATNIAGSIWLKSKALFIVRLYIIVAITVFLVLLMVLPHCVSGQNDFQTGINAEQKIASIIAGWIAPGEPGLAIAIVRGDSTILTKGYGMANLEHGIPIESSTVFNLGSVSKQFTAFAVAMLVDQGLISLDADVRTYLPELSIEEKVTVRQLLDHTSGFRDEANLLSITGYWMEDAISYDHVVRLLLRQKELMFSPGTEWQYSNSGYTLLAEVISRVTGQPFVEWVQSNMFKPLGMTNTQFLDDRTKVIPNMADSYDIGVDNSFTRSLLSYSSVGPTNLITTAEDMAKWAKNLIQPTVGNVRMLRMYDRPGVLVSGDTTDYAFGQFVGTHRGLRKFSHSGTIGSFNCGFVRYPDQRFIVAILGNSSIIRPIAIAKQIAEKFLQDEMKIAENSAEESDRGKNDAPKITPISIPLSNYAGKYKLSATGKVLEVIEQDGQLLLANISDVPLALSEEKTGSFSLAGVGAQVTFDFDSEGQINQMVLHFGDTPLEATRIKLLDLPEDTLRRFAGLYYSDELLAIYDLVVDSSKLLARHCRYPNVSLTPIDSLMFTGSEKWLRDVWFVTDETGQINGFRASSARAKSVLFRKLE